MKHTRGVNLWFNNIHPLTLNVTDISVFPVCLQQGAPSPLLEMDI